MPEPAPLSINISLQSKTTPSYKSLTELMEKLKLHEKFPKLTGANVVAAAAAGMSGFHNSMKKANENLYKFYEHSKWAIPGQGMLNREMLLQAVIDKAEYLGLNSKWPAELGGGDSVRASIGAKQSVKYIRTEKDLLSPDSIKEVEDMIQLRLRVSMPM